MRDLVWQYRWVAALTVVGLALVAIGVVAGVPELSAVGSMMLAPAYFIVLAVGVGMLLFGIVKAIQWAFTVPVKEDPPVAKPAPEREPAVDAQRWPFPGPGDRSGAVGDESAREPRCLGPIDDEPARRDDASNDPRFARLR